MSSVMFWPQLTLLNTVYPGEKPWSSGQGGRLIT